MQLKGEPTQTEGDLVRRTFKLEHLQREDFGRILGCSATNTDLVPSPQTTLKINMLRKFTGEILSTSYLFCSQAAPRNATRRENWRIF